MFTIVSVTTASVPVPPTEFVHSLPGVDFTNPLSILVSPALSGASAAALDIAHHFADLPDPRHPVFRDYHRLSDILVIALSALLSGAKSWDAIASFGRTKESWFRSLGLTLPNGPPSHDTYNRIFADLDPWAFQNSFTSWINSVCDSLGFSHIPIDGKALRGSRGPDGTCLHLVSAWAYEHRLSLAQFAVADKSNEITAIPKILKMLDLHGALVSIDAMGCQKDIVQEIRVGGGDYLLALKENQPTLYADVRTCFETALMGEFEGVKHAVFTTEEINHGRYEKRVYTVIYEPEGLSTQAEWLDLKAVVQVVRTRRVADKESVEVAYYISSSTAAAQVLAEGIRKHWSIENGQHWVLDVVFAEDRCRTRHGHAAENLAWLRKMVLSLFRQEDSHDSIATRQLLAASDDAYRLHLLHLLGKKSA
jgi:predicted transposase YbfD/YdcC